MALERIEIVPEKGPSIKAMFNPERYTVSKAVQYGEVGIPGLDAPVVQFVRGQNERIAMDLFFDTTEHGTVEGVKDVRDETIAIYRLLKVDSDLHAPPRVTLWWGEGGQLTSHGSGIPPWLVMESVTEEFQLFSPTGVPLRAKLTVAFREAWTIDEQLQETPRHSSDRTKLRRVQRGETLALIAWREYGDPAEWRAIAEANQLANPRLLVPGAVLQIPRLAEAGRRS